jgi:hypothetical protein
VNAWDGLALLIVVLAALDGGLISVQWYRWRKTMSWQQSLSSLAVAVVLLALCYSTARALHEDVVFNDRIIPLSAALGVLLVAVAGSMHDTIFKEDS